MDQLQLEEENARLKVELRIKSRALEDITLIATTYRKIIIEALNPTTKLLNHAGNHAESKRPPRRSRSVQKKTLATPRG
jgi:hypothetical protein